MMTSSVSIFLLYFAFTATSFLQIPRFGAYLPSKFRLDVVNHLLNEVDVAKAMNVAASKLVFISFFHESDSNAKSQLKPQIEDISDLYSEKCSFYYLDKNRIVDLIFRPGAWPMYAFYRGPNCTLDTHVRVSYFKDFFHCYSLL